MRKFILSVIVLGGFLVYALILRVKDHEALETDERVKRVAIRTNAPAPTSVVKTSTSGFTAPASSSPQTIPNTQSTTYKDGIYTGNVADAFYGPLQVQATISGGKITDVIFLQYPNDRNTSVEINNQAMPLLKQEAIQIQSENVDGVSGATQTSIAFIESLGNALKQAK